MQQDLEQRLRDGLGANFELVRAIGRGAHSYVYLARQLGLRRLVAVKVLRPELNSDPVIRRRFEREAQSAARLDHPHVTPIHNVGLLEGDVPYIIMKYIDGRTLEDALAATGPLQLEDGRRMLSGLASALAAAHGAGIVHRDVRPGNVFLEKQTGIAVLGDFGIAGLLETGGDTITRLTASGIRLGDTRYMSPEQIEGNPATEQSDVYAFGMLAYETLAGRGPYNAKSVQELIVAHLQQQPTPLASLVAGIDPPTAGLIERCLSKDPQRRPTAADLAARLAGEPGSGPEPDVLPGGVIGRFVRELKRRKVVTVTAWYLGASITAVVGSREVPQAVDIDWPLLPKIVAVAGATGLPVVLVLSWIYDITSSGIRRTTAEGSLGVRRLPLIALIAAIAISALLAWFLLGIL